MCIRDRVCILWAFPLSYVMFVLIQRFIGLRVSPEVEAAGIDLAYHGIESYPEFDAVELRGIQVRDWDCLLYTSFWTKGRSA